MKDPRNADRFAPLRTFIGTVSGPWQAARRIQGPLEHVKAGTHWVCDSDPSWPENAVHIATWDPETAREVLSLLEEAAGWVWEKDPTTLEECNWSDRLHALLARVTP